MVDNNQDTLGISIGMVNAFVLSPIIKEVKEVDVETISEKNYEDRKRQ